MGSSHSIPAQSQGICFVDGITFDDVLIVPKKSDVIPLEVSVATRLTRNIALNVPIVSAAMDTVTDARLAIALAQEGGLGIIHRNLDIARQADEVRRVKRSEAGVITSPITLAPNAIIEEARQLMAKHNISGLPVMDGGKLVGIITRRDLRFHKDGSTRVDGVMTTRLVTASPDTTVEQAKEILHKNKVEKLLLVDDASQGTHHNQGHKQDSPVPQRLQGHRRQAPLRRCGGYGRLRARRQTRRGGSGRNRG